MNHYVYFTHFMVIFRFCLGFIITLLAALPSQAIERRLALSDYVGTVDHLDGYGSAIVSSGDWLAIAAPRKISSPLTSHHTGGRVLLWKKDSVGDRWALKQQIVCSVVIPNLDDGFGSRLAMDGSTLLISSHIGTAHGQVHVYRLNQLLDQWMPDGVLTPPGSPQTNIGFGEALAISGEIAAISSPLADAGNVPQGGRTDIYRRRDGVWEHASHIIDTDVRQGEAQGAALAFRGSQILIGSPLFTPDQGRTGEGRINVFSAIEENWSKTSEIHPTVAMSNQFFGRMMHVVGDSVHIAGGAFYTVITATSSHRFTLDSEVTSIAANEGLAAVLRRSSGVVAFFSLQSDQSWTQEAQLPSGGSPLYAHFVENMLLLDSPYESAKDGISSGVSTFRKGTNALIRGPSFIPPEVMRVRHTAFGTSIASSGRWTVIGSPYAPPSHEPGGLGGLVFVYRGQPDGSHRFHSLLPDPVLTSGLNMDRSLFGQQMAVGEGWIAVAATRKTTVGYAECPAVVLYQYDVVSDSWRQHSLITPPVGTSNQGFGHSLSLWKDRSLLIGAPGSRSACLYQLLHQDWSLSQVFVTPSSNMNHLSFGHSVSLDNNALIVGAPSENTQIDGQAFIFESIGGIWRSFTRGASLANIIPSFGTQVSIHDDIAVARASSGSAETYRRRPGNTFPLSWLPDADLGGSLPTPLKFAASESALAIYSSDSSSIKVFTLENSRWEDRTRQILAFRRYPSLTDMVLASGQLFTSSLTEVLCTDVAKPPQLNLANSDPSRIEECVIGERIDGLYRVFATAQTNSLPVTMETTVEGDIEDFFIYGTRLVLQPGGPTAEFGIHFRPRTPGLKRLTLRRTVTTPGGAPVVTVIQARALEDYTPLQFTLQPVSATTLHTLSARVQGTRPWYCHWYRNGKLIPDAVTEDYQPTLAGTYHVVFQNPAGSITSRKVNVSLVRLNNPAEQVVLYTSRQAIWNLTMHGPAIRVEWGRLDMDGTGWTPVPSSYIRTTARGSTLTLPAISQSAGAYSVRIHKRIPEEENAESTVEVPLSLHVVSLPVITGTPWDDTGHGVLHPDREERGKYDWAWDGPRDQPGYETPVFTCIGLPPGILLDPETGDVSGAPTRLGFYTTQARVKIGHLQSLPVIRRLVVVPQTVPPPGVYETILDAVHPLFPQGAHLSITVQFGGSFSGTLRTGTRTQRIAGGFRARDMDDWEDYIRPSHVFTIPLPDRKLQTIGLFSSGGGSIDVYSIDPITQEQQDRLGYANLIRPVTGIMRERACPQVGRHAVGFRLNQRDALSGSGFGSITLGANYRLTFVGVSPEGMGLTASSWCQYSDESSVMSYFYAANDSGTVLYRDIWIPARPDDRFQIYWSRLPQNGSLLYPSSVDNVELAFLTSRGGVNRMAQAFPTGSYGMRISEKTLINEPTIISFDFGPSLRANFGSGASNSFKARLDLHAPTGFFTGKFTLGFLTPWTQDTMHFRNLYFKGMFLPEHEIGIGQFLLPGVLNPNSNPAIPAYTYPGQISIFSQPEY